MYENPLHTFLKRAKYGLSQIPSECAIEIPDLTAPDGSLHSDGCGMIRDSFAAQLCSRHDLPPDTTGACEHA